MKVSFLSFFSWRLLILFLMINHQGKSTYLLKNKTFLMKDGKQKNGQPFLTQPIHVLEHLMPLNLKLSILSKTNWLWMSTVPWYDNLLQIHTKALIEVLKNFRSQILQLLNINALTIIENYYKQYFWDWKLEHLVSNVQQSRMGAWVNFQRKDLEVCTTPMGKLEGNDFNCLISVIPDSTCCFLRLEQFHNDNVTHVRATMVIYC